MQNTVPAFQVCKTWPPKEGGECRGRGSSSRVYPQRHRCSLGLVLEGTRRKGRDGGGGSRGRSSGKGVVAATGSEAQTCDEMFSAGREGTWLEGDGQLLAEMGGAEGKESPSPAKWEAEGRAHGGSLQRQRGRTVTPERLLLNS